MKNIIAVSNGFFRKLKILLNFFIVRGSRRFSNKTNLYTFYTLDGAVIDHDDYMIFTSKSDSKHRIIDAINIYNESKISFLPAWLKLRCPYVTFISVAKCSIRKIFFHNFSHLTDIHVLILSDNMIEVIEPKSFRDLRNLEEFQIKNNRLKNIPDGLFMDTHFLMHIDFSNNRIVQLSDKLLSSSIRLEQIYFQSNALESLPDDLLSNNLKLIFIDFSSNKIKYIASSNSDVKVLLRRISHAKAANFKNNICIDNCYIRIKGLNESCSEYKDFRQKFMNCY